MKDVTSPEVTLDRDAEHERRRLIARATTVGAGTLVSRILGLFACGECAAGINGANRLGGNSLSDLLVLGKRAGVRRSCGRVRRENLKTKRRPLTMDRRKRTR